MKQQTSVQIQDLWIDLDEFHLRQIDLNIAGGEYFVILGPTGSGKTVLLETLAGLHRPRQGRILFSGQNVTNLPPEKRGIGFVYQDYALFPHLSVAENIAFGLKLQKIAPESIEENVRGIAGLLGIEHLLGRRPKTLSGGESQRVALARALVVEPRLLLLDEPLSALDPEMREELQRELARLHRQLGTTTLHVTHDFEEAVALGDRIAIMNEGRIVQIGSPEEIFKKPESEFAARFVGVKNIFEGEIRSGENDYKVLRLSDSLEIVLTTPLGGRVHASIRPEDIIIAREAFRSSARNTFRGRIVDIVDKGVLAYITVNVPPELTCAITRRSLKEMELREGLEIYVAFKATAVHVF